MAKVSLGKKIDYQASGSVEPIVVANGTDSVALQFESDYSKISLAVTSSAGVTTYYDAALLPSTGAKIFTGSAANVAAVYAQVGAVDAVGSIYLSTAGLLFVQVANAGAAADWETVTTS